MHTLSKSIILSAVTFLNYQSGAAVVSYADSDTTTSGEWRTAGVSKSLDADSNNIYGTDGYLLTGSSDLLSNPSYANVSRLSSATFPGNGSYTIVDDPLGGSDRVTGLWYSSGSVTNQFQDLASIAVTSVSNFRLGVLIDNTDLADISPNSLRLYQVSGGSGDSGSIASYIEANNDSDWYFFDIIGAQAGDTFTLAGANTRLGSGPQDSNGIGGLTFDTIPEPSWAGFVILSGIGLCLHRRRLRTREESDSV